MASEVSPSQMPLLDHLRDLRKRTIKCGIAALIGTIVALFGFDILIHLLAVPFESTVPPEGQDSLYITNLFEGFFTRIKLSFILGVILASPIIIYQILRFLFPGLRTAEKRLILVVLFSSLVLAGLSLYIGYFKLIPFSVEFLTSHHFIPEGVGLLLNYQDNIFYIFRFLLYATIAFQFPIVLELLLYFNLIKRKTLLKSSRFVILGIFIASAIVTPPDFVSQIGIAVPLIALYFLTILIAKIFRFGE